MAAATYNEKPEVERLIQAGAEITDAVWELVQENEALQGTDVYWEMNDRRFD